MMRRVDDSGTNVPDDMAMWVMLGFFIAFATKLPAVSVHNWLPDAHSQAPTAGSVILAGVLLKTGAYGLIRFTVPLFPEESAAFAPTGIFIMVTAKTNYGWPPHSGFKTTKLFHQRF